MQVRRMSFHSGTKSPRNKLYPGSARDGGVVLLTKSPRIVDMEQA